MYLIETEPKVSQILVAKNFEVNLESQGKRGYIKKVKTNREMQAIIKMRNYGSEVYEISTPSK